MTNEASHPHPAPNDGTALVEELAKTPHEPAPEGTTSLQLQAFLAVAMARHREGQRVEAEQMYRQALRWQPDHPDAYHPVPGLLVAGRVPARLP
jgi:hypothetical protein